MSTAAEQPRHNPHRDADARTGAARAVAYALAVANERYYYYYYYVGHMPTNVMPRAHRRRRID